MANDGLFLIIICSTSKLISPHPYHPWYTGSEMFLSASPFLLFNPCVIPSWVSPVSSYLCLINTPWQKWWMSPPREGHKRLTSILCVFFLGLSLAHYDEASTLLGYTLWRGPCGKAPRKASSQQLLGHWGPQHKSQQGTESYQQPYEWARKLKP